MNDWIYFDNNATTPIDPKVVETIIEELSYSPSNASSIHHFGQMAKARLSSARYNIAKSIGKRPDEITFNSGATEALNSLIRGYSSLNPNKQIISSNIEHSCIYKTLMELKEHGRDVLFLSPDSKGLISSSILNDALSDKTGLVVLSAANAETGVKNEIDAIASLLHLKGINFIVDAVAFFGKEHLTIHEGITSMVFSGHKFHGPQGSGFIYKKKSFQLDNMMTGGEQEFSIRAGTENLAAIMGIAKAVELLDNNIANIVEYISSLRDTFESEILKNLSGVWINGEGPRVSNTSNMGFDKIDGESLLINLDLAKIAVSHGSACASGAIEPSRILTNMGLSNKKANSSIRFSFSRMNTLEEVYKACDIIISQVNQLRKL